MNLPGFSAEASLKVSSNNHWMTSSGSRTVNGGAMRPATVGDYYRPICCPCRDGVPQGGGLCNICDCKVQ